MTDRRPRKTNIRHGECKEDLPKIFDEVYHYDDNYPKKQDYAVAYAAYKSRKERLPKGQEYDPECFRTTVSRTINEFLKKGTMLEVGTNRYVPNNEKYKKYVAKLKIFEEVLFAREDILKINERAVVIALKTGEGYEDNLLRGKQLLQSYLSDSCYSISILDDALIIFLCKDEKTSCESLKVLVEEAYNRQNKKRGRK